MRVPINPDERLNADMKHAIGGQGSGSDEIETEGCRRGAHDNDRTVPRSRPRLLQRPEGQVCRLETSKGRIK